MVVKKGILPIGIAVQTDTRWQCRYVNREQQYRNIIEELQDELRRKFTLDGFEKNDQEIRSLFTLKLLRTSTTYSLKPQKC